MVALIKSITKLKIEELSNEEIAKLACSIEFDESNGAMGRQDQYLCALGGVNFLSFEKNGIVKRKNYPIVSEAICKYCEDIYLINTSISRSAQEQLTLIKNDPDSYVCIEKILDIAESFIDDVKDILRKKIKRSQTHSNYFSYLGVNRRDNSSIGEGLRKLDYEEDSFEWKWS